MPLAVPVPCSLLSDDGIFQPALRTLRHAGAAIFVFIRGLASRVLPKDCQAAARPYPVLGHSGGRPFVADPAKIDPGRPAFFWPRIRGRQPAGG